MVWVYNFKCNLCGYATRNKSCLKQHQESVHDGLVHRCPIESCPSTFKSKSNINYHIREMHENNEFKWNSCDYVACSKNILKKHIQIHHSVKKYSCSDCDYKAGVQYLVNKHYKRKHGESLRCDLIPCSQVFKSSVTSWPL